MQMKYNKNNIFIIILIFSLTLFSYSCKNINREIKENIESIQNSCPQNLGNGATLTKVELSGNKTIEYYITISDMENIDSFDEKTMKSLKEEIIKDIKKGEGTEEKKAEEEVISIKTILIEYGYTVRYYYYNTNNKELGKLEINKNNL